MNLVLWYIVGVALGFCLLSGIRVFRRRRPCWWYDHDKRWLALEQANGLVPIQPGSNAISWSKESGCTHNCHPNGSRPYKGRWQCRRCGLLGKECLGDAQDWKIEHEQLVPDDKKWANWSQEK